VIFLSSSHEMSWNGCFLGKLNEISPGKTEIYYELFERFPDEFVNEYYLSFRGEDLDDLYGSVRLQNEFPFSFISVPHPSADTSNYLLLSKWSNASLAKTEGVKLTMTWTD